MTQKNGTSLELWDFHRRIPQKTLKTLRGKSGMAKKSEVWQNGMLVDETFEYFVRLECISSTKRQTSRNHLIIWYIIYCQDR